MRIKKSFSTRKKIVILLLFAILIIAFNVDLSLEKRKLEKEGVFLSPYERVNIVAKDLSVHQSEINKLYAPYGLDNTWKMYPVISKKVKKDFSSRYVFELELEYIIPGNQKQFDKIIKDFTPFARDMIKDFKKHGEVKPEVELQITKRSGEDFKGSEGLHTSYVFK